MRHITFSKHYSVDCYAKSDKHNNHYLDMFQFTKQKQKQKAVSPFSFRIVQLSGNANGAKCKQAHLANSIVFSCEDKYLNELSY